MITVHETLLSDVVAYDQTQNPEYVPDRLTMPYEAVVGGTYDRLERQIEEAVHEDEAHFLKDALALYGQQHETGEARELSRMHAMLARDLRVRAEPDFPAADTYFQHASLAEKYTLAMGAWISINDPQLEWRQSTGDGDMVNIASLWLQDIQMEEVSRGVLSPEEALVRAVARSAMYAWHCESMLETLSPREARAWEYEHINRSLQECKTAARQCQADESIGMLRGELLRTLAWMSTGWRHKILERAARPYIKRRTELLLGAGAPPERMSYFFADSREPDIREDYQPTVHDFLQPNDVDGAYACYVRDTQRLEQGEASPSRVFTGAWHMARVIRRGSKVHLTPADKTWKIENYKPPQWANENNQESHSR